MSSNSLSGVYAAAITPIDSDGKPAVSDIPEYLDFLAQRGCHGALMLGTTGEGPSFDSNERISIFKGAAEIKQIHPTFKLLAGTGSPSLEETIFLTKSAFEAGFEGVVVLPPYYFHQATDEGLYTWFREIIHRGTPQDGKVFGYHIPAQSKVPLSRNLLLQLRGNFPDQFAGIKDSSANGEYANNTRDLLGNDFVVLVGNDRHLSRALSQGAGGCITAMANIFSQSLRSIWDAHNAGEDASSEQVLINEKRAVLEKFPPYGPTIKALAAHHFDFPRWSVRPPLLPLDEDQTKQVIREMNLT